MNINQIATTFLFILCSTFIPVSAEVIPGTDLSVNFESGHIVGSGRHLNMQRVPVINVSTGEISYYDASFKFTFSASDGFVFEQITSAEISPPISVANIIPGVYKTQSGICYELEGPSALDSSRSIYTIRGVAASGCNSIDNFTAVITSGAASGHPDIGDRDIVPHLQASYVYGVNANTGSFSGHPIGRTWEANELIGIRQSGDQLIFSLFSEGVDNSGNLNDFKDAVETAILTKVID